MNPITTFVRTFGSTRALANARAAVDAPLHEERLVQRLVSRLESLPAASAPTRDAA